MQIGPCQQQKPVIEELEKELTDVKFEKVNVDEDKDAAGEYGVMSIPTLVIEKDGEEVERLVGFQEKSVLKEKLEALL